MCVHVCMYAHTYTCTIYVQLFLSQVSIQRQQSGVEEETQQRDKFKRQLSKRQLSKLQEEWDKDIPQVSLLRVVKLNASEWWIILVGEQIREEFSLTFLTLLFAYVLSQVVNIT